MRKTLARKDFYVLRSRNNEISPPSVLIPCFWSSPCNPSFDVPLSLALGRSSSIAPSGSLPPLLPVCLPIHQSSCVLFCSPSHIKPERENICFPLLPELKHSQDKRRHGRMHLACQATLQPEFSFFAAVLVQILHIAWYRVTTPRKRLLQSFSSQQVVAHSLIFLH